MIKKFITIVALSIALISETSMIATKAIEVHNPNSASVVEPTKDEVKEGHRHKHKMGKEHAACDIKLLTSPENMKLLSEEEKKSLEEIDKCLKSNKDITKDQVRTIMALKDKVAKCKLGDEDFKKFKELMRKERKGGLSPEEKAQLDGYFKRIGGN